MWARRPAYFEAHMDFLRPEPPFALDDPGWPILTRALPRLPARINGGTLENALVSPGCVIEGSVRNSVLSPGVRVEAGAEVEDCVILHGAVIRRGARLKRAIVDEGAQVEGEVSGEDEPVIVAASSQ
jgi:glucose-1-phosphate adenylyltransferase